MASRRSQLPFRSLSRTRGGSWVQLVAILSQRKAIEGFILSQDNQKYIEKMGWFAYSLQEVSRVIGRTCVRGPFWPLWLSRPKWPKWSPNACLWAVVVDGMLARVYLVSSIFIFAFMEWNLWEIQPGKCVLPWFWPLLGPILGHLGSNLRPSWANLRPSEIKEQIVQWFPAPFWPLNYYISFVFTA